MANSTDERAMGFSTRSLHAAQQPDPTTAVFEERVAALEGGIGALATASGEAAQFLALSSLMEPDDDLDPENFRLAITPHTRALSGEDVEDIIWDLDQALQASQAA